MMSARGLSVLLMLLLLSGCGGGQLVVLMPDRDGSVGGVTVSNQAGSTEIDKAGQAAKVSAKETPPSAPEPMEPAEIKSIFKEAQKAEPIAPLRFLLYFKSDSIELTDESADKLPSILQAINNRAPADVSIVGHADTAGNESYNFRLSKKRAQSVAALLKEKGLKLSELEITSHGEENPLIPTGDNVSETRNRRVEVIVR